MTGWRTALRVARREARRAKGRAALVVAMIVVPVAPLAFAAAAYDTFTLSPAEQADRQMGTAQALVAWPQDGPVEQEPSLFSFLGRAAPAGTQAGRTTDRLLALLPAGTRVIPDQRGSLTVRTATGVGTLPARMLAYTDPLARGILRPLSGRAPAAADEIALTSAAGRRLAAGVGAEVRLADGSRTFRVVGLVEDPDDLRAATIVLAAGALPAQALVPAGGSADPLDSRWLVATPGPLTWAEVKQLNTHGVVAVSRYVLAHPPSQAELYAGIRSGGEGALGILALVGGLALLEVVLLAGPAFAVGARRRRRDLALVAASGGTPAHVRRIVLADGAVLGSVAAVLGVALGIAVFTAGRPLIETHLSHSRSGGLGFYPLALAVLAGLAVATGLLAALVPAWISSRQDVVAALAGRRGITRSRRRWLVLGVLMVTVGAVLAGIGAWRISAGIIIAGLAAAELGLVLSTPALVGLVARFGRWLPLAPRIALRDTARNRTAAAPAISAVMAAVIGSVAVGVVITADDQRARDDYRASGRPGDVALVRGGKVRGGGQEPLPATAVAVLRDSMPVDQVHQISLPTCGGSFCVITIRLPAGQECPYSSEILQRDPTAAEQRAARHDHRCDREGLEYRYLGLFGTPRGMTFIIEPAAAPALVDIAAADVDRVTAALRSGAVVVDDARYVQGGRVTVTIEQPTPASRRGAQRTVTAPGFVLPQGARAPIAMMTAATARTLGLAADPVALLATTTRMPTVAEEDRLQAALAGGFVVYVERGAPPRNTTALTVLAIVAGVIALGAAAIATGLAAADGRAELGTLAAVGASPRIRRALSLSQSGVIAGLGSVLGSAAGLGASAAVLFALNQRYASVWPAPTRFPITVPWLNLGIALVVVPLTAMLGAGLLTRSRLPIERRGV